MVWSENDYERMTKDFQRMATECRLVAAQMSLTEDRERLLKMAKHYDERAEAFARGPTH